MMHTCLSAPGDRMRRPGFLDSLTGQGKRAIMALRTNRESPSEPDSILTSTSTTRSKKLKPSTARCVSASSVRETASSKACHMSRS